MKCDISQFDIKYEVNVINMSVCRLNLNYPIIEHEIQKTSIDLQTKRMK